MVAFFAYAVCSTSFDDDGIDNAGPAFTTLCYFCLLIPLVLYFLIYIIPKLNAKLGTPIVLLILAGCFELFAVCLFIGYCILTSMFIEGDFPVFETGATVNLTIVKGRAYFLGVGVFVSMAATAIAFDMLFDKFIPGYKDGGKSVSDQEAQGQTVPTANPDSQDSE